MTLYISVKTIGSLVFFYVRRNQSFGVLYISFELVSKYPHANFYVAKIAMICILGMAIGYTTTTTSHADPALDRLQSGV